MRALALGPLRAAIASCAIAAGAITLPAILATSSVAATVAPGAPAACSGVQITDAVADGHHPNTDLTAAWLTTTAGRLQAVLVSHDGSWKPAHDDSLSAGWALLWQYSGATRYVRLVAAADGALSYDAGTWTRTGGFTTTGPTTGSVSAPGTGGWAAIDVPAEAGGTAGSLLATPFALTYDGQEGADLHWVDRAPGGVSPDGTEAGADVVVSSCAASTAPLATPAPGASAPSASGLLGITLTAPGRITGARAALTIGGAITPAQPGITVTVAKTVRGRVVERTATTAADGSFALRTPITERTQLRATAAGLGSQTITVDVTARVRIAVRRTRSGGAVITGTVSPRLPGRVLWLRSDAVVPSATTRTRSGRFSFRLAHPGRGRYQALFLPDHRRALRALSPTGIIR